MKLAWYWRRMSQMSATEIGRRARDQSLKVAWRVTGGRTFAAENVGSGARLQFVPLDVSAEQIDAEARIALIRCADRIMDGEWDVFAVTRRDMQPKPDWFLDPSTGLRSSPDEYSFSIPFREPDQVGNVKYVWELSRMHHLTVLAAAYQITGKQEYASTIDRHLRSWWDENRLLRGIHWTSGIEIGLRLISWTWIRRLLSTWSGVKDLFEENPAFGDQLYWHSSYLARLPSHGSSANNHLIAEAAGLFVASCAFPLFRSSDRWRESSAAVLVSQSRSQTFASGLNRELATDYHGFVLELLVIAGVEGAKAGHPLGDGFWETVVSMFDALAAVLDISGRPPRQGDSDEGSGLLLDAPTFDRWASLLSTGRVLAGGLQWWPTSERGDVRSTMLRAFCMPELPEYDRPSRRPNVFRDAGLVLLRDIESRDDEIWCRCDSGPHGYLSLAAHAHSDALSIEVRIGGHEILVDPGTYSYHTSPEWRSFFRGTRGHNTLTLDGVDQSVPAGPFMWSTKATAQIEVVDGTDNGSLARWVGSHDGYERLGHSARHERSVTLDRTRRELEIRDRITSDGAHDCVLAFHLGPDVDAFLEKESVRIEWSHKERRRSAVLTLPESLSWVMLEGSVEPRGGWYSESFDRKVPAPMLCGTGVAAGDSTYTTRLSFADVQ